ncbi:uncharacterized protein LOC116434816 [Nomia melanderi]|uniref:uncharacterized protein LOC116434816 n=1 Tax=Nomia melanderi TaxID=2448451 RepID=UPI001304473D|nr:uncharacterized protein LOC116434816 [Nomia melanderi]
MFIYFVALIATPLIIFGLLHARVLNDWLRSRFRNSLTSCTGLTRRPQIETLLIDEDEESACVPMTSLSARKQVAEIENVPIQKSFDNDGKTSDAFLTETEKKLKNLSVPRYSFDSVLSEDRERDIELDTRVRKENAIESLKDTIERSMNPSTRLNITQIYNLIQKETLKQKLLDVEKRKFNESVPLKITEHLPLSSENEPEHEDESRSNPS